MVEFCTVCGTSLPKGDLTIQEGKVFTSHDYTCPHCGKPANPKKREDKTVPPDPMAERDLIFRKGQVHIE